MESRITIHTRYLFDPGGQADRHCIPVLYPRDHRNRVLRRRGEVSPRVCEWVRPRNGVAARDPPITIHMQQVYRIPTGNTLVITTDLPAEASSAGLIADNGSIPDSEYRGPRAEDWYDRSMT